MTDLTLEALRAELAPMRAEIETIRSTLVPMRAQLDGLPLINRSLTVLQQETRSIRAAFNDFALTNPTKGSPTGSASTRTANRRSEM